MAHLLGDILDGFQEGLILQEVALKNNILPEQVITVGDGAKELGMLSSASLGMLSMPKVFCGNVLPVASLFLTLMHCSILWEFPVMKSMPYLSERV